LHRLRLRGTNYALNRGALCQNRWFDQRKTLRDRIFTNRSRIRAYDWYQNQWL